MYRRDDSFNGRRFGRGDADLSMAVPDGRQSVYRYIRRDVFDLYSVERFGRQYGLSGHRQFGRQFLLVRNFGDGHGDHPRSDRGYHSAGWF